MLIKGEAIGLILGLGEREHSVVVQRALIALERHHVVAAAGEDRLGEHSDLDQGGWRSDAVDLTEADSNNLHGTPSEVMPDRCLNNPVLAPRLA